MRKVLTALLISLFPIFSCYGQDNPYIFIEHERITLRYSTRSQVEKLLGSSEKVEYFEQGGEDFLWKNFFVCSYDGSKLSFHYDQNGTIIRVTVNAEYSREVRFLEKDIKYLYKKDIQDLIKTVREQDVFISQNFIMYEHTQVPNAEIIYSFWFDDTEKIQWIDMYHVYPL